MAQAVPEHVEDRVRLAALAKRVRTTEFFKDFDKLRTGYITSECKCVCVCVCTLFSYVMHHYFKMTCLTQLSNFLLLLCNTGELWNICMFYCKVLISPCSQCRIAQYHSSDVIHRLRTCKESTLCSDLFDIICFLRTCRIHIRCHIKSVYAIECSTFIPQSSRQINQVLDK